MNVRNYALYYPTIEFQDYEWLWSAALLWDRIYRIVPDTYIPNDQDEIRALVDTGEIGIPINPGDYAQDIAQEFINKLDTEHWDASALTYDIPDGYRLLHQDKVDVKLRDLLITKGNVENSGEWLHVPVEFAAHYMTYLANAIAEKNNLSILSDCTPAWASATYFKYNGEVEDFPRQDLSQLLATIVVRDFIPDDIMSIDPKKIIKFRQKYRDERQRFMLSIKSAATRISACKDPAVIRDQIEDIKKDIESSLKDYRRSLGVLNITGLTGIKSLTFPALTKVACMITGQELNVQTLAVVSTLGFAIGLVSGLSELSHRKKRLSKESDYSYLVHLRRNWKKCARYDNDYNYYLCREMEEFIND